MASFVPTTISGPLSFHFMIISTYIMHFPCDTSWNSCKNITTSVFFFDRAKQKISMKLKWRLLTLTLKSPLVPQTLACVAGAGKGKGKVKKRVVGFCFLLFIFQLFVLQILFFVFNFFMFKFLTLKKRQNF